MVKGKFLKILWSTCVVTNWVNRSDHALIQVKLG